MGSSTSWNPALVQDTRAPPGLSSSLLQTQQTTSTSTWKLNPASQVCTQTSAPSPQQGHRMCSPRWPGARRVRKDKSKTHSTKWHLGTFNYISFLTSSLHYPAKFVHFLLLILAASTEKLFLLSLGQKTITICFHLTLS